METKELSSLIEVEQQIEVRISDFNSRRFKLKRYNNYLVIFQAVFSSVTTALIAINSKLNIDMLAFIAIAVSAMSSLAGLFLSQFMFHERLASQISTVCSLRELSAAIKIRKKLEQDDRQTYEIKLQDVEDYFNQMQTILNVANHEWQKLAKSGQKRKDK
ncbi:hypothetical protein [Enterovibrio coralii]|uniref:SMODS and SLOG-associating 2TM effector domain-containing protein n=1 Tax=Enterovibrio coralii TaxID=294935 RepID=A0A135I9S8_9GAMM|nr:hypothetical protein [Enterovibrio coralii]KXF82213.1 hypothetical protein ATN88_24965 [Enterovibrio coralii]